MNKLSISALLLFCSFQSIYAQEQETKPVVNPPVSMEVLVGSRGISYQTSINKKLQSNPKLGFFGITSFVTEWESSTVNDYMIQGHATYSIAKGLSANAGFHYVQASGIRPTVSLMYNYVTPELLIVIFPRIDVIAKPNTELFGLVEYKPLIKENLRLYGRIQGMYVDNLTSNLHERTGLSLRAGIVKKEFTFGVGYSYDKYGPFEVEENNVGAFLNVQLF